ncbi:carbohydrate sulfotransferase 9-like [Symsagittifera roscoffensis]
MKTHSFDSLMKYLNWGAGKNSKNSDDVYAENGWIKDSGVKKWGFFPENETSVDVEAVLAQRLFTLQEHCDKNYSPNKNGFVPRNELLEQYKKKHGDAISVLSPYNLYECRIAKTGTTMRSVVLWKAFHGGQNIHTHHYQHPSEDLKVPKLDWFDAEKISFMTRHYLGVIFVREPLMKIVSSYFSKFCNPKWNRVYAKKFGFDAKYKPTLGEVLRKLASGENLPLYSTHDDHFMSYFDKCDPCLLEYDFIGRFETLQRDLKYLIFNKTSLHEGLSRPVEDAPYSGKFEDCRYSIDNPEAYRDVSIEDVKTLIKNHRQEYAAFGYDAEATIKYFKDKILDVQIELGDD